MLLCRGASRAVAAKRGARGMMMMMARSLLPKLEEKRPAMTKIVATIGPVSEQFEPLQQIVRAGMRIMRLNFSHATYEEAELRIKNLEASTGLHRRVLGEPFNNRGVLLDIQGPKIRTGSFVNGAITLEKNKNYVLTTDEAYKLKGTEERFYIDYKKLYEAAKPGGGILIDDGNVVLEIKSVKADGVHCTALNTGRIKDRRGVNIPGAIIDLPALTDKDKENLRFGVRRDIDFVAASFVRKAQDIHDIRAFLAEEMAKQWPAGHPHPKIIAKIESTEALKNFDEILATTDAVMVARGDLGVEIPVEEVANAQKMMVRKCKLSGKPVIVATQMLESMLNSPRPTRAEVSDVTHAVYDGADAVMLSGESASGQYPVEAVATMRSIIEAAEDWQTKNQEIVENLFKLVYEGQDPEAVGFYEASASSAVMAAGRLHASCIIVHTEDGTLARVVAKYNPSCPIIAFTSNHKVARQLSLHRGVHHVVIPHGHLWAINKEKVVEMTKRLQYCKEGDRLVVLTGELQSQGASISSGLVFMECN